MLGLDSMKLMSHSTPVKACGPKRGPVVSRWTKAELVDYAVSKGRLTKTQANKLTLENLCSVMRDAGLRIPSHHSSLRSLPSLSPLSSHHSSPRSSSRHSSPRASSRHSSPVKKCGPLRGPNRYTKPELVAFAVSRGMTKSKASKMTIDKLCKFMKSPGHHSPRASSRHSSPRASPRASPSSSPRASPSSSPGKKKCGPKTGPNRWTKPELVEYFVSNGFLKKSVAKKMTISELCYFFKKSASF